MPDKIRCQCGAQFSPKDLSGAVRVACPVCRSPLASRGDDASPAATESRHRPMPPPLHTDASTTVFAAVLADDGPSPVDSRAAGPLARIAQVASPAVPSTPAFGTRWQPPAGLTNHAGQRLDASKSFPWGPPAEIGTLISADCNVPQSGPPSHATPLLIAAGIWLAFYLALGEFLPRAISSPANPIVMRCASAALGLLAGGLALVWLWPASPRCTFVGTEGAAYLTGTWGQPAPRTVQVLVFREAAVQFGGMTHVYKNFIYQDTKFGYRWYRDVNQPPLLEIEGEHTAHNDLPEAGNLIHFALRVEEMWTDHLVARLGSVLSADRSISFPCLKTQLADLLLGLASSEIREIRLNLREIQFVYDNRTDTTTMLALVNVDAHRGVLKFQQDDASWFGSKGTFRVDYHRLGNAKAFLFYLSQALSRRYG
jgi:hypothetical protein